MIKSLPFLLISMACFLLHDHASGQVIDFGKSYVNITKGLNGGTIEPGDILEIRASFVVRSGVVDSCSFSDNIPAGTSYIPGTIRIITNEGKIYKQFTDAVPDDEGWITGTNVRINLGYNQTDAPARSFRRGRLRNTHKPSYYNSACIMVASYRVQVTAALGSIINIGAGFMTYRSGISPIITYGFPSNRVMIYTNMGMCANITGLNALGTEFNGSFGSGKPRNRGTSANVPPSYSYQVFTTNTPNDYNYGIANNTSTRTNYTTSNGWAKPDLSSPTHRVFSVWDIIGDHTGAANPLLGNPAADTVNNNGGYMLVVNASYRIDSAFQHTISGLCPNTYYEISFWIRNICSKCGCDSNGRGATGGAGYIPTVAGPPGSADSSGVNPNITFEVNGLDYYSTGNLAYTGQWVKKGFTYLTGPAQTSFTLKLFNNAPGGGGNDWALDDITVATCFPNLSVTPSVFSGCADNPVFFGAIVRSFFSNYNYYKWQRSTDGGATWANTGVSGVATPMLSGGQYEYTADYPPFIALPSDSGHRYRVVVATTPGNLGDINCSYTDLSNVTTLSILNCFVLPMGIENFRGWLHDNQVVLGWQTVNEFSKVDMFTEKSSDGIHFHEVGKNSGQANGRGYGSYQFTDPEKSGRISHYRLRIEENGKVSYSKIITLNSSDKSAWAIHKVVNPFNHSISIQASIPENGKMAFMLTDTYGRLVMKTEQVLERGSVNISIPLKQDVKTGIYILTIQYANSTENVKLMKQ